jgi:hypothetical protein
MPREFLRLVRGTYRRKAFGTDHHPPYPPDAIVAFYALIELAEEQPERGRFESEALVRVLLEGRAGTGRRFARQVPYLMAHDDLVTLPDGRLYLDGWDELQEGDVTVSDRVQRHRNRRRNGHVTDDVTVPVTPDVTPSRDARVSDGKTVDGKTVDGTDPAVSVIDYIEGRARRPFQYRPGSKVWETLMPDVRDFGAERVIAAMSEVPEEHPDVAQLVFGASRVLHPLVAPKTMTPAERERAEAQRKFDAALAAGGNHD